MKKTIQTLMPVAVSLSAVLLAGCASVPSSADLDKLTADIVKASFRDQGIVKVDRAGTGRHQPRLQCSRRGGQAD